MPRLSAQFEDEHDLQRDSFARFVTKAIMDAAPSNKYVIELLHLSCTPMERAQLRLALKMKDVERRNAWFWALAGAVLARLALSVVEEKKS